MKLIDYITIILDKTFNNTVQVVHFLNIEVKIQDCHF
jgi:hypothetical protein